MLVPASLACQLPCWLCARLSRLSRDLEFADPKFTDFKSLRLQQPTGMAKVSEIVTTGHQTGTSHGDRLALPSRPSGARAWAADGPRENGALSRRRPGRASMAAWLTWSWSLRSASPTIP
jgi:hypothetical protein